MGASAIFSPMRLSFAVTSGTELETAALQTNLRDQGSPENFVTGRLIVDARSYRRLAI